VAALHARSWRDTYAGIMPDDFLAGPVELWPGLELHLWVLSDNVGAARFYEREGGVPTGVREEIFAAGFTLSETRYAWRSETRSC
jgi:hypothetical protein